MKPFLPVFFLALLLIGCAPAASTPAISPPPASATPAETPTPTVPPPAPDPDPLVILFPVLPAAPNQPSALDELSRQLSASAGLNIQLRTAASEQEILQALTAHQAQAAWLSAAGYLLAHQNGQADAALVAVYHSSTAYGLQFIANARGGFQSFLVPSAHGADTAGAAAALAQFAGSAPCLGEPDSLAGYALPLGILKQAGVTVLPPLLQTGQAAIVRAVYNFSGAGSCAWGATLVDSRSRMLADLPDVNEKIIVIWRSEAVVPNEVIAFSPTLSAQARAQIARAWLSVTQASGGQSLLQSASAADSLQAVDDATFNPLRDLVRASGLRLQDLVK